MILMRINGEEEGGTCVECKKNAAEIKIVLGMKKGAHRNVPAQAIYLCRDCAWDLSECLDKTVSINFKECSK